MTALKESSEYENFLDQKVEVQQKGALPIDVNVTTGDKDKYWIGMPEFVQEEKKTYKTIYLHFRNEEDYKEFVSKYKLFDSDQVITDKTKSMWYPHLDKDENSLKRWFEE